MVGADWPDVNWCGTIRLTNGAGNGTEMGPIGDDIARAS